MKIICNCFLGNALLFLLLAPSHAQSVSPVEITEGDPFELQDWENRLWTYQRGVWNSIPVEHFNADSALKITVIRINAPVASFFLLKQGRGFQIVWRSRGLDQNISSFGLRSFELVPKALRKDLVSLDRLAHEALKNESDGPSGFLDGFVFSLRYFNRETKNHKSKAWRSNGIGDDPDFGEIEKAIDKIWRTLIEMDPKLGEWDNIERQ